MYRKSAQIVRTELLTPGFVKQLRYVGSGVGYGNLVCPFGFQTLRGIPALSQMISSEIILHDLTAARAPRAESATRMTSTRIIGSQRPWLE